MKKWTIAIAAGFIATASASFAADTQPSELKTGASAFGDFSTDAPGTRRQIKVSDIPQPFDTPSSDSGPQISPRPADYKLHVPAGFEVDLLADHLTNPRKIITAPNGDLFIAESGANRIKTIRQGDDGKVASTTIFASGLSQPFGMAFYPPTGEPQYLYIGNTDSVVRFAYKTGDTTATGAPEKLADLPGGGRLRGGGHWTRDVAFSQDGKKMFVSVGSHSNVSDDAAEKDRADILQFNPDGTGMHIYASGIRNAVGIAIEPTTGALWASVNERDALGDNLPPDYITHVEENAFYGWPWYYLGDHQDPRHAGKHPELADKITVPDVLIQAHSASLAMTFYTANQFPPTYHGYAFAAEHGSWNRQKRTGYKVIYVPIKDGKALGEYDDFLTGFVTADGNVWGRPVGVTVDKQGSLVVTDDGSNALWRVRYTAGWGG